LSTSSNSFAYVETQRLLLRAPIHRDSDAVFAIHGDPETNRFNPHGPATRESAQDILSAWCRHWKELGFGYWSVALKSRPADVIGFGGVGTKNIEGVASLNLYFRLSPSVWGQGLAVELGGVAMEMAFSYLPYSSVNGVARLSNTPSRKTLERLGLALVRVLEDPEGLEASAWYRRERPQTTAPNAASQETPPN
jgi:RimJ/RimL family protein N-acetyltransferase